MLCFPNKTSYHSWVSTIIIKPAQLAIICLSFAEYVVEAFAFECPPPENIIKIVGVTTVGKKRNLFGRDVAFLALYLYHMVFLLDFSKLSAPLCILVIEIEARLENECRLGLCSSFSLTLICSALANSTLRMRDQG